MAEGRVTRLQAIDLLPKHIDPEPAVRILNPILASRIFGNDPRSRPAARPEARLAAQKQPAQSKEEVRRPVSPLGRPQILREVRDLFCFFFPSSMNKPYSSQKGL